MFIIPISGFAVLGDANTFTQLNTFSSGIAVNGAATFSSSATFSGGLTVSGGGESITGGGLTVTGGNISVGGGFAFSGNGSGLTSLNASNLSTGTLPVGRFPLTGVSAGTYASPDLTIDNTGRITAATAGGGGGGTGVTAGASLVNYPAGTFPPDLANTYNLNSLPVATSTNVIDGTQDLLFDGTHGSGNSRVYINYGGRHLDGTLVTFDSAALNVIDSGSSGGACNLQFASVGLRLFASPPGYSGTPSDPTGGFINFTTNSPISNPYAFWSCNNPSALLGAQVNRAYLDNTGLIFCAGGGTFGNNVSITGNITISNTLTAATKHFEISHPIPAMAETTKLIHTSVESPRANLLYRGRIRLSAGRGKVDLDLVSGMTPGTICLLADMANADVFLENRDGFAGLRGELSGSILSITCQVAADADVAWMVVAERLASTMSHEPVDAAGHLVVERAV